ncbi:MAG: hypothetical protein WC829_21600 [Hyphomicrobium sp.]
MAKTNVKVDQASGADRAVVATVIAGEVVDVREHLPVPMPEPEGGWPADEFTGMDGRFVRDRFTGVRSRAE